MSETVPEDPRVAQARIDRAVAEADKAKAEAAKAAVDAAKASREESAATSTLGVRQREAESRKAIAEAEKADFDAQQSRVAALVPDLGKVQAPALAVSGSQALFSATVTQRALDTAATSLPTLVLRHPAGEHADREQIITRVRELLVEWGESLPERLLDAHSVERRSSRSG